MNEVATALKAMLDAGVPREVIIDAIATMVDAIPRAETPEERRRRVSRESSERFRAKSGDRKTSPRVTKRHQEPVTDGDQNTSPVTNSRHETSPLAGATEDNLTTVVIEPNLTSPNYDAPDRAMLDVLEGQLAEAVGVALASKAGAPKLFDLSPILALLKSGQGPPADLEMDVLPTLRAAAARSSPGTIKTWAYFTGAIREARDRRLAGAPKVIPLEPRHERPDAPSAKRAAREGNHSRAYDGAVAAAVARQAARSG